MSLDLIDCKMLKPFPLVKKKHLKYLQNPFDNKSIDEINLSCIFHDPNALPNASGHFDTKNVVYTLKNAMGSNIFNSLWIKIITILQWEVLKLFLTTKCANVSLIVHIIDEKSADYEKAKESLTGIK